MKSLACAALCVALFTCKPPAAPADAGSSGVVLSRLDSVVVSWSAADRRFRAWSSKGEPLWTVALPGDDSLVAPPCGAPDSSVYARGQSALYAISSTGSLAWSHRLEGEQPDDAVRAPAAMSNSGVVFASSPSLLVALAPDGVEMWKYLLPKGETIRSPPTVAPNGLITIVTSASVIQLAGDGVPVWQKPAADARAK